MNAVVKTLKRHLRSWTIFDFKSTPIRKRTGGQKEHYSDTW